MSVHDSDNDYEDDYEEEFEPEASEELPTRPLSCHSSNGVHTSSALGAYGSKPGSSQQAEEVSGSNTEEVVSLEEYMKRLEDAPGDDDDEENDIMNSITRGLDGLSPSPSAGKKRGEYNSSPVEEDSDDAILKKFGISISPRSNYKEDFVEQYLRKEPPSGSVDSSHHIVSTGQDNYGQHNKNMGDIAKLVERGAHDRSVPNDTGLKVIELKKKVSQLQERYKRDNEIKNHLKSICTSLKNELMVANQKVEYMRAELQSKKKVKKKKTVNKTKAAAEENNALRDRVLCLQDNEASLLEKVEALSALNNELNLQLKQSISREMDWRTAHQELSERVIKQFNSPGKKGSVSVGNLHGVSQSNNRVMDHGYGNVQTKKKQKAKPEFRLDHIRSESDPSGKRKAKRLPPI